jgi:hypothetical protein
MERSLCLGLNGEPLMLLPATHKLLLVREVILCRMRNFVSQEVTYFSVQKECHSRKFRTVIKEVK